MVSKDPLRIFRLCYKGKLYVTGGKINGTVTNQAEVIDVANHTGTQTALPPMQVPRNCHASAAAGSRVFAFGGLHERDERISSCEFYDTRTGRSVKTYSTHLREGTQSMTV